MTKKGAPKLKNGEVNPIYRTTTVSDTSYHSLRIAADNDPEKPLAVITHVAFGNGGVNGSGEPLVPLETQTALNSELARYEVESVTYPAETTARYAVTIPKDALVGEEISEAALVDSDGDVVAIKTMYPKKKDEDVSFTFEFDDEF